MRKPRASRVPTPLERQRQAQLLTGYGPIALRRVQHFAVVEIEARPGEWIEIIREPLDGNFCHIIEPLGIEGCMMQAGFDPSKQ